MLLIKLHGIKKYKNSGNIIRSNQNKKICYLWVIPTKEEFENEMINKYGYIIPYKIIRGKFNINENSESEPKGEGS